jgi:eukaryotic-like serine/threonine-protein kinase
MNVEGRNAMIGKQIANYQITEKLGEGGMGVVYKGVDTNLGRPVAVKMLTAELAHNPDIVERFRAEARAQANLSNPNLAVLYAFLVEDGTAFMVMEFVEGQTFEQMIRARGPISPEIALPLFKQALQGVGAAHRMGIVHRDIKPSNIMLNTQGVVKVMDFGIAKVVGTRGMTRTGMQLGTPAYMAPEQIQNKPIDTRTDIYALGITLYQMLSGQLPFQHESDFETMNSQVTAIPPPMKQMFPYAPIQYQNVVTKALEKDPNNRFQTVEEFCVALENPESVMTMGTAPTVLTSTVAPTVVAAGAPTGGRTVLETPGAAAAATPAMAKTVMQTGVVAAAAPATSAAMPASAQAPGQVATKKGGWNSGYTFAAIAVAAAAIILAVVSFGKKGSIFTASQVNAPSSSLQGSPLSSPQPSTPASAPVTSVPDDLMKSGTASDPSKASPVPGGAASGGDAPSAPPKSPAVSVNAGAGGRSVAVNTPGAKVNISPNGGVQVNAGGTSVSVPGQEAPPNMSGMSKEEVDELEHRIDQLSGRAAAINNSLNRMEKQQAASGYGLRGDIVAAQESMTTNLHKAQSYMEHGDPVKAKKYADSAAANAETLEKFLGR